MLSIKILRFWFPAIIYSGIIFMVSSWPNVKATLIDLPIDKLVHFIEYIPFGFLVARAIVLSRGTRERPFWPAVLIISVLYGLSDEVHQHFVPGRTFAIGDICADTLGAVVGVWLYQKKNNIK